MFVTLGNLKTLSNSVEVVCVQVSLLLLTGLLISKPGCGHSHLYNMLACHYQFLYLPKDLVGLYSVSKLIHRVWVYGKMGNGGDKSTESGMSPNVLMLACHLPKDLVGLCSFLSQLCSVFQNSSTEFGIT